MNCRKASRTSHCTGMNCVPYEVCVSSSREALPLVYKKLTIAHVAIIALVFDMMKLRYEQTCKNRLFARGALLNGRQILRLRWCV